MVALYDAHRVIVDAVRRQVEAAARARWAELDGDYSRAAVRAMAGALAPIVQAGAVQTAAAASAHMTARERVLFGAADATPVRQADLVDLRGVPDVVALERAGTGARVALIEGATRAAAARDGERRLVSIATTAVQLAKREQSRRAVMRSIETVGYRRIPEGPYNCALCIVASTQRYHKRDLLPIHPACDCDVEPIYGREDPGQVIDRDRLELTHDMVAERFGEEARDHRDARSGPAGDYRNLIVVRQHGELGPVLTVRGHQHTYLAA